MGNALLEMLNAMPVKNSLISAQIPTRLKSATIWQGTPLNVRGLLDAAQNIPVAGDLLSGGMALYDAAHGDYGSAALNAVGLLPFVPGMALGMKTIKNEKQLSDVIAESDGKYIRWSRGPTLDKKAGSSRDYLSGGKHEGFSAVPINPDWATDPEWMARRIGEYGFLRMKDEKISPYIYSGKKVGTDSDGYDLINEIEGLYRIDPSLIDRMKSRFKK